ncbi:ROK family transcriptional regulator [Providencia burhodogranariea]|uniref:ROK family protein n=1 Tax=Providencia burhodogranariea DSM 19968 TaxID=1141662 RepID=K8WEZ9_9GAMM|nr:ROK family transcriptional regulator [Providencia burhodogranariea]EKT56042.1 ROK family protein [Providencia burhodogranariea DSM 19968]
MLKKINSVGLNVKQVRLHNRKVIMTLLYKNKAMRKSQLANAAKLTIPAISKIIAELLSEGLIAHKMNDKPIRGNSDGIYTIADKPYDILCLSVTPTRLAGIVVDGHINQKFEPSYWTIIPSTGAELVGEIVLFYQQQYKQNQQRSLKLVMGIHGQVDTHTGTSLHMPQAPWHEAIEFKYLLESRLNTEVILDNDCVMLALAEKWLSLQAPNDFCVMNIDYGIGSSFIINDEIYRGKQFGSGQIGHTIVTPDGKKCGCGRYGCLETIASSEAMLTDIRSLVKHSVNQQQELDLDALTFHDCVHLYHQQDSRAVNVAERAARIIGISLYNFLLTLNINQIIIYGNTTRLGTVWLNKITEQMCLNPFENPNNLYNQRMLVKFGQLSDIERLMGIGFLLVEQELEAG